MSWRSRLSNMCEGRKVCRKCGIEKSLGEFYKNKAKKGGLHYQCKKCVSSYSKNRRVRSSIQSKIKLEDLALENEKFIDIKGYVGLYKVSNLGRVFSNHRSGKILSMKPNFHGYPRVVLVDNLGKQAHYKIHTLVYKSFIGEIPEHLQIDHINGIKTDNTLPNLRLLTNIENGKAYKKIKKGASSKYRGVYWAKLDRRWRVGIGIDGKWIHIGTFKCEIEAAKAYNKKALEIGYLPEALSKIKE